MRQMRESTPKRNRNRGVDRFVWCLRTHFAQADEYFLLIYHGGCTRPYTVFKPTQTKTDRAVV